MADVEPLRALHYDLAVVGALADVVAPPYDVIDPAQRAQLVARSPYNVVAVDLPQAGSAATPATAPSSPAVAAASPSSTAPVSSASPAAPDTAASPTSPDPYAAAGDLFRAWQRDGALTRDPDPAIWAHTQDYTGPDGVRRTRRGFFCRVRLQDYGPGRVRPHERTHPGPREDRLRLMRATAADTSPIFSLYSDPANLAWQALEPATAAPPWGETTDPDGTVHRLWRVADPAAIAAVQSATRDAELLIADGHHRYETALAYARELDGKTELDAKPEIDGKTKIDAKAEINDKTELGAKPEPDAKPEIGADHDYLLMCLVALEDPGLTVFPTHRVVKAADPAHLERLEESLRRDFELAEVPLDRLAPPPGAGPLQLGYVDARRRQPLRATLRDQAIADAALPDRSPAYRELDTGVLETLLLKGALGLSDEDISDLHGIRYARDAAEAAALVLDGGWDAAFLMRPTPVDQVREVAAAGENMPPKSTYFYPKLLTGLLFNQL